MALDTTIKINGGVISQPNNTVLTDVELEVSKGELLYIIGKTGSGKSSLLKALYGELEFNDGNGYIVGYNLKKIKPKQIPFLRRKLGIVFQDFQLLTDRTIKNNLMFALRATGWKKKADMEKRIGEVLEKVGLTSKEYKMPHELSGGEQQRVGVARALLNDPEVILADEPTGNLDPETSAGIVQLLLNISKNGRSVIIATHDYAIVNQFPSRILECKDGKLLEYNNTTPK